MPTYEYECGACGHRFEVQQHMSDPPLTVCPACGKSVRRILSGGIGIEFKGNGFYVNDSNKAAKPAALSGQKKAEKPSCGGCKGCSA